MSSSRDLKRPLRWAAVTAIVLGLSLSSLAIAGGGADGFADPTRPPHQVPSSHAPENGAGTKWTLGSVLISPDRRIAIINGKSVQPGDRVGGALVLSITNGEVTLRGPRGKLVLALHPAAVKRDTEIRNE